MRPIRILSGGQTGADLAALRAGLALGYVPGESLGGMMPRGFLNELGSRPWMAKMYGMTEHASPMFQPRTKANVQAADLTIVFGETRSPGSRLTISYVGGFRKPFRVNPSVEVLRDVCAGKIVNVAGNRESSNRGIEAYVYRLLIEAWAEAGERLEHLRRCAPWPDPPPRLSDAR